MRVPGSLVGHKAPIVRPAESPQLDYEGEIAMVIGKAGKAEFRRSVRPSPYRGPDLHK